VPVRSQPAGAAVLVDGRDTGVVTNGEVVIAAPVPAEVTLTFRKEGHRDESRRVPLPLAPGEAVSVGLETAARLVPVRTEPPGATVAVDGERVSGLTPLELALAPGAPRRVEVSLEGYASRSVEADPAAPPAAIELALERLPPPGTVAVASSYPVDVYLRDRALARGEVSPRVSVPGGRQVLTLVSTSLLLRRRGRPGAPRGEATLEAPAVGRLNVRAAPDNCEVFVNGAFLDYPPILDRPVAAGRHTVGFRWPDGARSDQVVEVTAGAPAFVFGRKE
jgi:hypothetical protein